jgi:preprotein translocase subunit SecF
MEFNTTTIAAILTILGYSINNTIVVFDRIRENRRIYPDEVFVHVLDRSLTETLSRTIITTLTTMLAVLSLIIFTTGSMRDFALALQVGMISGVYTTTFIASNFVNYWEQRKVKRERRTLVASAGQASAAKIAKGVAKA